MSNPVSPELQSRIASWRQRASEGLLTIEEMREAIIALRAGRVAAVASSAASTRKKAIAAIPSADDLLGELADL